MVHVIHGKIRQAVQAAASGAELGRHGKYSVQKGEPGILVQLMVPVEPLVEYGQHFLPHPVAAVLDPRKKHIF